MRLGVEHGGLKGKGHTIPEGLVITIVEGLGRNEGIVDTFIPGAEDKLLQVGWTEVVGSDSQGSVNQAMNGFNNFVLTGDYKSVNTKTKEILAAYKHQLESGIGPILIDQIPHASVEGLTTNGEARQVVLYEADRES